MKKNELQSLWVTGQVAEAIIKGREDARTLYPGYEPEKPHLAGSARADASVFFPEYDSWEKLVELIRVNYHSTWDESKDAITLTITCRSDNGGKLFIGTEKTCYPKIIPRFDDGDHRFWTVVDTPHGLKVEGPAEPKEYKTWEIAVVFTNEGNDNFVLATIHPGKPELPGKFDGLKPGDKLDRFDLSKHGIMRVIPR